MFGFRSSKEAGGAGEESRRGGVQEKTEERGGAVGTKHITGPRSPVRGPGVACVPEGPVVALGRGLS